MFNLQRFFAVALFAMCCLLLQACSYYSDFYIVNASSTPVIATLKFSYPVQQMLEELQLRYTNRVLEVDDNTTRLLKTDLSYVTIDSLTISVRVPPYSTVLIGGAINRPIAADSFRFEINGSVLAYSLRSISKDLKKSGGIVPPFHFSYIIAKENTIAYEPVARAY